MKKICGFAFVLLIFTVSAFAQSQEKILVVSLNYNQEVLSFENTFLQNGTFASDLSSGEVTGVIYSAFDEELFSFQFEISNQIVVEEVGVVTEENAKQVLILPYFENADRIVFFNEETQQTLIVPIAFLSRLCGNNQCDISESFGNCPIDCPSGGEDNYCDTETDNVCDLDCSPAFQDSDCSQLQGELSEQEIDRIVQAELERRGETPLDTEGPNPLLVLGTLVLLSGLILAGFLVIRMLKKKENDELS